MRPSMNCSLVAVLRVGFEEGVLIRAAGLDVIVDTSCPVRERLEGCLVHLVTVRSAIVSATLAPMHVLAWCWLTLLSRARAAHSPRRTFGSRNVRRSLGKLYFPKSWRFSEDLDFGVEGQYQGSKREFRALLNTISGRSGIEFTSFYSAGRTFSPSWLTRPNSARYATRSQTSATSRSSSAASSSTVIVSSSA